MADGVFDPFRLDPELKLEDGERPVGYRAIVLPGAEVTELGVRYQRNSGVYLLTWTRVERAFAAEIGEPEGVRTIVFDLAVGIEDGECVACRFDADPGTDAMRIADSVAEGIGRERCSPSLLTLAAEGLPTRRYVDLDSFEQATLDALRVA